MPYSDREDGVFSGAPVELWEFSRGSVSPEYWRYTTSDVVETYLGNNYTPDAAIRSAIIKSEQSEESGKLTLELPLDHPVITLFIGSQVWEPIGLKIFSGHREDAERLTVFRGVVGGGELGDAGATLTVLNIQGRLNRRLPVQVVSEACSNMLGDQRCKVDLESMKFTGTVASLGSRSIEVTGLDAFAAGDLTYFVGGFVKKGGLTVGFIQEQDIDTIHMLGKVGGLVVSDSVDVYPGCDWTLPTCKTRFNNAVNRLGWKSLPLVNPFVGVRGFQED